jgi:hypothetical protein
LLNKLPLAKRECISMPLPEAKETSVANAIAKKLIFIRILLLFKFKDGKYRNIKKFCQGGKAGVEKILTGGNVFGIISGNFISFLDFTAKNANITAKGCPRRGTPTVFNHSLQKNVNIQLACGNLPLNQAYNRHFSGIAGAGGA